MSTSSRTFIRLLGPAFNAEAARALMRAAFGRHLHGNLSPIPDAGAEAALLAMLWVENSEGPPLALLQDLSRKLPGYVFEVQAGGACFKIAAGEMHDEQGEKTAPEALEALWEASAAAQSHADNTGIQPADEWRPKLPPLPTSVKALARYRLDDAFDYVISEVFINDYTPSSVDREINECFKAFEAVMALLPPDDQRELTERQARYDEFSRSLSRRVQARDSVHRALSQFSTVFQDGALPDEEQAVMAEASSVLERIQKSLRNEWCQLREASVPA